MALEAGKQKPSPAKKGQWRGGLRSWRGGGLGWTGPEEGRGLRRGRGPRRAALRRGRAKGGRGLRRGGVWGGDGAVFTFPAASKASGKLSSSPSQTSPACSHLCADVPLETLSRRIMASNGKSVMGGSEDLGWGLAPPSLPHHP